MINVALAGDFALNLHALASLFHPLPGIRVVSISRNPALLVRTLTAPAPAPSTSAAAPATSAPAPSASTPAPSASASASSASAPALSASTVASAVFASAAPAPAFGSATLLDSSATPVYPHVVLLDVNFELRPATQVITFIKNSHPNIRLIVLGLTRDEEAIARLFRAGADRYLPKNADPRLLEQAIREVVACDAESFSHATPTAPAFSPWPTITDTEYRYFKLAISDVSNEDIRKKLRICESSYTRLVQQTYDRFNVRSRDGLAVALFKQRWLVRDDL
jgi:DNA-binding NarL/FixJ family response regulator